MSFLSVLYVTIISYCRDGGGRGCMCVGWGWEVVLHVYMIDGAGGSRSFRVEGYTRGNKNVYTL